MKRRGIVAALTRRRISTKPSADSLILLQLGNEWNGLALDFTDNTYAMRLSLGAETLLGSGPSSTEVAFGCDFTDNTYALASNNNMLFPINAADSLLFSAPYTVETGVGIDFMENSYSVRQ